MRFCISILKLRVLIRKLAESVKQPLSFNRLSNLVSAAGKKISTDTVIDYLGYLKDTWLLFPMENIVAKLADKESNKKYYFFVTACRMNQRENVKLEHCSK